MNHLNNHPSLNKIGMSEDLDSISLTYSERSPLKVQKKISEYIPKTLMDEIQFENIVGAFDDSDGINEISINEEWGEFQDGIQFDWKALKNRQVFNQM